MIDFKNELSSIQYDAVTYTDGPELVLAGAGSGKTRVLTYKIAYLIEAKGIQPRKIIALTFTNKAAKEMVSRLESLLGSSAIKGLNIGTFHSVFARILRKEIDNHFFVSSYTKDFSIFDEKDSKDVLDGIIEKLKLSEKIYSTTMVAERISKAKNRMISSEDYCRSALFKEDKKKKLDSIAKIYIEYDNILRSCNAMDFDDILLNMFKYLLNNRERRQLFSNFLSYCLVDEFQDTNLIQMAILRFLTEKNDRLFAVGDDAQSIYAFRGAVIGNILNFEENFPGAKEFKMEENYRSTRAIVNASNRLIVFNSLQRPKNLFSNNEEGDNIVFTRKANDKEEADFLVTTMKEYVHDKKYSYGDFAILYRNNSLSLTIEKTLFKNNVRYVIYGGVGFFQRKEIKDVFSYLRFLLNPDDNVSLSRILNFPKRDIGNTAMAKLSMIADYNQMSLWKVISNTTNYKAAITRQKTLESIGRFVNMVNSWRSLLSADAYSVIKKIMDDTDMINVFKSLDLKEQKESSSRTANVYQLIRDIKEYVEEHRLTDGDVSLAHYVAEKALFTDEDEKAKSVNEKDSVKLITIHKSKGLEFPVVFVVGMDEEIFPCKQVLEQSSEDKSVIEEERRLCYVAMTRAKKELFFTGACQRFLFGSTTFLSTSRFVSEAGCKIII